MDGKEMFKQFKTMEESRAFAEAQYKTIVELSRKIQKLEDDKKHLESLLESTSPLLPEPKTGLLDNVIPDEQVIAEVQLNILKSKALSGHSGTELTLEETKKVEAYSKILATLKSASNKKPEDIVVKQTSSADLLKLIDSSKAEDGSA